ncbi:MAG: transcription initiation factor TFIIIB [Amphibacillus sp.]|nr:transcription initiation factor TFIIIB [Amphibacillus sp.]
MNQQLKITECPKCGGKELGKGIQTDYAALTPYKKVFSLVGSAVVHTLCTDCGFIIESHVEKPHRFKSK